MAENHGGLLLLRAFRWLCPVQAGEWGVVLKISTLMSLITANFWMVHNLKDTLVMTAPASGAECINYLKIIVFFATLAFVAFYSRLFHRLTQRVVLMRIVTIFCITFALFAVVLLPNIETLHMHPYHVTQLQQAYPALRWVFPVFGYWTFSLFYIAAEMWSMTGYAILFWQFVNTILTLQESKRFYSAFIFFNGLTTIVLSVIINYVTSLTYDKSRDSFASYLDIMQWGCVILAIICLLLLRTYRMIYNHYGDQQSQKEEKAVTKEYVPFWGGLRTALSSVYLGLILLLGISYNLTHTLVDITWKQQVRLFCETPLAVQEFFWNFTLKMGFGILLCSIMSSSIVSRMKWRVCASITPALMLLSGTVFFCSIAFRGWDIMGGLSTVMFTVAYGQWHELFIKSLKHSLFNVTRELVCVPLDFHMQVKGKAVADVLGGRIGKLLGAGTQGVLLLFIAGGTQADTVPYAMVLFWGTIVLWFVVIALLNKRFLRLISYQKM